MAAKSRSEFALEANGRRIPVIGPRHRTQKIGARNRKVWKRVNVSNNPLDSKEFLERLRREWADSCNALLPGYAVIDHRSFKARGIERIPTIHEGYASREMEKRGGRGDLCEENRRIQALNRLLDALRAMIGRLSDQAQGILTAVNAANGPQRATGPFKPEPAERHRNARRLVKRRHRPRRNPRSPSGRKRRSPTGSRHGLTSGWPKTNANRPNPTWRRHGTSPTPPTRSTSAWAGAREATDSACENAGNAKGRHPKTPARNLERHPYQRVTDTPSTPEPSAVAMRIHGPAATGVYVTPLIAKVICPDLLPVV